MSKKKKRIPLGISAEKKGKVYEVRLYYEPDIFLDGPEFAKYDKVYKIVFKTKSRFIVNLYVNHMAKKYDMNYMIKH